MVTGQVVLLTPGHLSEPVHTVGNCSRPVRQLFLLLYLLTMGWLDPESSHGPGAEG